MRTKILKAGCIIDLRLNKVKYNSYKTRKGRFNYVYDILNEYLKSMTDTIVNGVEIRNISITSNNYYGITDFCIINDLDYSAGNLLPLNENFVTIRIFQIDLIGIICGYGAVMLVKVKNDNFCLDTSHYEIF